MDDEIGVPPPDDIISNLESLCISELLMYLRTEFRSEYFRKVEKILASKEENLKKDLEMYKNKCSELSIALAEQKKHNTRAVQRINFLLDELLLRRTNNKCAKTREADELEIEAQTKRPRTLEPEKVSNQRTLSCDCDGSSSGSDHDSECHSPVQVGSSGEEDQANSSGDHLLGKTAASAPQLQSGHVSVAGVTNKLPYIRIKGTSGVGQDTNHSVTKTACGSLQALQKHLQHFPFVHNEIAKKVENFLHPRLHEHPRWSPPSTDYMSKSSTCCVCKNLVDDVEHALVCDACEKGNHIKCLVAFNERMISKCEWHCPPCLQTHNQKPLRPKYGCVTRIGRRWKIS